MKEKLNRIIAHTEQFIVWYTWVGALIILVQMFWISYGVFVRYGLGSPDRVVTEATALLLFPVAFCGLAYALYQDAYPKVTLLTDHLPQRWKWRITIVNYAIMLLVGLFFSYAGVSATLRAYQSGAASEILRWPRYYFWAPGALSLLLFTYYTALRFVRSIIEPEIEQAH